MGPGSPVQFRPIDVDPKPMQRSKLMDLGHVVQKSRDTLNCLSASLVAQLPPDASKQLGIVRAFGELGDAFAQDVKNATRDSFERGVAHGKWLESAGETTVADAHEEVAKVRRAFHELQLSYREMHVMYQEQIAQNAHLKACAKTHKKLWTTSRSCSRTCIPLDHTPLLIIGSEARTSETIP